MISYNKGSIISNISNDKLDFFTLKTKWDVDTAKKENVYTWFREIDEKLDNGWVVSQGQEMLMLGGYSYLGLNNNEAINNAAIEAIKSHGTGTSGSPFLAGTSNIHITLEKKIAKLHKKEAAMIFSSGYQANISSIAALVDKGDYVICDKLNHASILDGAQYSKATVLRYRHNDMLNLEHQLQKIPTDAKKLLITDSVFSMSGEPANLPEIIKLCKKYSVLLMVDECHSMYVLGKTGGGITEYFDIDPDDIDIIMSTISKAIPASGGYIAAKQEIINFLKHEARGFIYSIALSPVAASAGLMALSIFETSRQELVSKLHNNTKTFKEALNTLGVSIGNSITSIVPILIGDTTKAAHIAKQCQDEGLYIHAIFPPVVPEGKAILRASIKASHTDSDLLMSAQKISTIINNYNTKP